MAAITTPAEAYTRLHTLNSPQEIPTGDSDGEDITGWLNSVADVVTFWNQNKPANAAAITIHNKELAFNSQQDRDGTLLRRHNAYNATSPPSLETDAELRENQRSWGTVDNAAVNSYVIANYTFYLVSAQAPLLFTKAWDDGWFEGTGWSQEHAQEQHRLVNTPFHATALYAYNGQWSIDDSAYSPSPANAPLRLSRTSGLNRYWRLFTTLRGRSRAPQSARYGGGGNAGGMGRCREMACHWLIGEILTAMGDNSVQVAVNQWTDLALN